MIIPALKTVSMTVGEKIKEAREKLGLSQVELAKKVGVSRGAIWGWESGSIVQIRANKIAKLAAVLDLDVSELQPFGGGGVTLLTKGQKSRFVLLIHWTELKHLVGGKMKMAALKKPKYIEVDLEVAPECLALRIEDDANAPEFAKPDVIIIDPTIQPTENDYVLVRITRTGDEVFREYVPRRGGAYDLVATNPKWKTITVNDSEPAEIIGVLDEHRKKRRRR